MVYVIKLLKTHPDIAFQKPSGYVQWKTHLQYVLQSQSIRACGCNYEERIIVYEVVKDYKFRAVENYLGFKQHEFKSYGRHYFAIAMTISEGATKNEDFMVFWALFGELDDDKRFQEYFDDKSTDDIFEVTKKALKAWDDFGENGQNAGHVPCEYNGPVYDSSCYVQPDWSYYNVVPFGGHHAGYYQQQYVQETVNYSNYAEMNYPANELNQYPIESACRLVGNGIEISPMGFGTASSNMGDYYCGMDYVNCGSESEYNHDQYYNSSETFTGNTYEINTQESDYDLGTKNYRYCTPDQSGYNYQYSEPTLYKSGNGNRNDVTNYFDIFQNNPTNVYSYEDEYFEPFDDFLYPDLDPLGTQLYSI